MRQTLSANKWFKKQYRTDADAEADELDPCRCVDPPCDDDYDVDGEPLLVASADVHGPEVRGRRTLNGTYRFVRKMYVTEIEKALLEDERYGR